MALANIRKVIPTARTDDCRWGHLSIAFQAEGYSFLPQNRGGIVGMVMLSNCSPNNSQLDADFREAHISLQSHRSHACDSRQVRLFEESELLLFGGCLLRSLLFCRTTCRWFRSSGTSRRRRCIRLWSIEGLVHYVQLIRIIMYCRRGVVSCHPTDEQVQV